MFTGQAARYDDLDDLKCLESAGVSLDAKDSHGRTGQNVFIFVVSVSTCVIDHMLYVEMECTICQD